MPWYALVVDGGHLAPGGELRDVLRHRPPHPARSGEVLAGAGVVDRAVGGRGEAALDAPYRVGDVEVGTGEVAHGLVGERLHPLAERLFAGDPPVRVGVE